MDFLNPLTLALSLSLLSLNLFKMSPELANQLTGRYDENIQNESIQSEQCPQSFTLQFSPAENNQPFILKRLNHLNDEIAEPRIHIADDAPHMNFDGDIIKTSVVNNNTLKIESLHEANPFEKVVETFIFDGEEGITYQAELVDEKTGEITSLCTALKFSRRH